MYVHTSTVCVVYTTRNILLIPNGERVTRVLLYTYLVIIHLTNVCAHTDGVIKHCTSDEDDDVVINNACVRPIHMSYTNINNNI